MTLPLIIQVNTLLVFHPYYKEVYELLSLKEKIMYICGKSIRNTIGTSIALIPIVYYIYHKNPLTVLIIK